MIFALAITGPTASGKTALSIEIAKRFSCEIISCDSMQIYQGMDIGTAKATEEEQAAVPHHLIDIISPKENYSAQSYRAAATEAARDIAARGKIPLFVGGTGLYIDSVIRPEQNFSPESDPEYRERLLSLASTDEGIDKLWGRLMEIDPATAEKTHKNNVKRVIRALEVYDKTGIPKSTLDEMSKSGFSDIRVGMITIDFHNRENLYDRVDRRVELMMEEGLFSEVKALYDRGLLNGENTASSAIGYKELISHIRGECRLPEAVQKLKLATRRYAKRQLTWFRHEKEAVRLYADSEDGRLKPAEELLLEAADAVQLLIYK